MVRPPLSLRLLRGATYTGSAVAVAGLGHLIVNLRLLRRPPSKVDVITEPVSVLLPLRNEAHRVVPCLRTLMSQEGLSHLEILILDDESTDGTTAVVESATAKDPRVRLLAGAPLVEGWLGKPHACAQLAAEASGSVLVFVDADVTLAPSAVASTIAVLRSSGLDLVSPYPRQQAHGWLPRLVQPLLQWSWLTFLPLRIAESSARPSLVAANGQLLAVDTAAYRAAGGHAGPGVRGAVLEDIELLKAFKRNGFRGGVVDGSDLASCEMYATATELRAGYAKSLWAAFTSPAAAIGVCALLVGAYVLPPAALCARDRRTRVAGAVGASAAVVSRLLAGRRTRSRRIPDALGHSGSVVAFVGLTAESFARRRNGSLTWKGRAL